LIKALGRGHVCSQRKILRHLHTNFKILREDDLTFKVRHDLPKSVTKNFHRNHN